MKTSDTSPSAAVSPDEQKFFLQQENKTALGDAVSKFWATGQQNPASDEPQERFSTRLEGMFTNPDSAQKEMNGLRGMVYEGYLMNASPKNLQHIADACSVPGFNELKDIFDRIVSETSDEDMKTEIFKIVDSFDPAYASKLQLANRERMTAREEAAVQKEQAGLQQKNRALVYRCSCSSGRFGQESHL